MNAQPLRAARLFTLAVTAAATLSSCSGSTNLKTEGVKLARSACTTFSTISRGPSNQAEYDSAIGNWVTASRMSAKAAQDDPRWSDLHTAINTGDLAYREMLPGFKLSWNINASNADQAMAYAGQAAALTSAMGTISTDCQVAQS